jgi:hypothetical protein
VIRRPLAALAVLALLALAVGLAGSWGPLVQLGLALAVASYAAARVERDEFDPRAPLVAAALLAAAELAYTSIEPPARRVWPFSLVVVVVAAGVAALLLAAAGVGGGRVRDLVLGVVAAAAALALVARLAATATRR